MKPMTNGIFTCVYNELFTKLFFVITLRNVKRISDGFSNLKLQN